VAATGAYCWSLASNYNHVPRPAVVAVRDGIARVIVRGETEADLLARDAGLDASDARRRASPHDRVPHHPSGPPGRRLVGSQVARLLLEHSEELTQRIGARIELVGIAVRDPGARRDVACRRPAHHRRRVAHPRLGHRRSS
jgi:hypothetical protein